jgi:hypothetical protein
MPRDAAVFHSAWAALFCWALVLLAVICDL